MKDAFINRINHLRQFGISEKTAHALAAPQNSDSRMEWHNLDSDNPELYIYEQIGFDWMSGEGVSAMQFADQLNNLEGKDLTVRINSPGGDVFDGVAIYNQLNTYTGHVHVIVDGIAASAASIIAMAGDRVSMAQTSQLMIHDAWTMAMGNEQAMREIADVLEKIDDQIAGVYSIRSGRRKNTWREIMNKDTYFTPEEAIEAKLVDDVLQTAKKKPKAEKQEPEHFGEPAPRRPKGRKVNLISAKLPAIRLV
jgi:ATP-dependent Clp protease protease subunit